MTCLLPLILRQMIPVMLFGVLFAKKRYNIQDYLCVGLITAGIVTFNLSRASSTAQKVHTYLSTTNGRQLYLMHAYNPARDKNIW